MYHCHAVYCITMCEERYYYYYALEIAGTFQIILLYILMCIFLCIYYINILRLKTIPV